MANASGWHRRSPSAELRKARDRKYNSAEHRQARRTYADHIAAGLAHCWRCGQHIPPGTPGRDWHVGHNDDGTQIMGPEHARECNIKAAARKGALIANAQRKARRQGTPYKPPSQPAAAFTRRTW